MRRETGPLLGAQEFERLASETRMGAKAREMARLTLVEGHTMQAVAASLGTIPQRVRLAVGSIHRVQASLTWGAPKVPKRLAQPLSNLITELSSLSSKCDDSMLIQELESMLKLARERPAR